MSIDLINSVVNGDYVSANRLFEERLANIQEKKLYELKRMIQAEVFGGMTRSEIEAKKKAGYRKAADVLPDPRDIKLPLGRRKKTTLKKKVKTIRKRKKLEEINIGLGTAARIGGRKVLRQVGGVVGSVLKRGLDAADAAKQIPGAAKKSAVKTLSDPLKALGTVGKGAMSLAKSNAASSVVNTAGRIASEVGKNLEPTFE